jgi:hypothetical protein
MNFHSRRITSLALILFSFGAACSESRGQASSKPIAYGLVIDNTDRESLDNEIDCGTLLVNGNGPADETFVVRFTNSDNISIVQDFTAQKATLADALGNMFVESGSPAVLDAIYLAAQHFAGQEKVSQFAQGRRALVLIAHGADNDSFYRIDDVLSLLRETDVRVYVTGVSADGEARTFLDGLAKRSGGAGLFSRVNGRSGESGSGDSVGDWQATAPQVRGTEFRKFRGHNT